MKSTLEVKNLRKWFRVRKGFTRDLLARNPTWLRAVDTISFNIASNEIFCLAGESGCGKTTTARLILRLIEADSGSVLFDGDDVFSLTRKEMKEFRKKMQIVFQDPYESMDPRLTVGEIIGEALRLNGISESEEGQSAIANALEDVRLAPADVFFDRYPHQMSGGQRQRVMIARALVLRPSLLVADEPVSMIDASTRSEILQILFDLRNEYSLAMLYVTHDLSIASVVADRIALMYLGKIVEIGKTETVIGEPLHPYTKALLSVVPVPDPSLERERIILKGEIPSPIILPSGCRFRTRCPYAMEKCSGREPELTESSGGRFVACYLAS